MNKVSGLVLVGILIAACGPNETPEGIENDLKVLANVTVEVGTVQQACEKLDEVCRQQGVGCDAYARFCDPLPTEDVVVDTEMICAELERFCSENYAQACQLHADHCQGDVTMAASNDQPAPGADAAQACCSQARSCLESGVGCDGALRDCAPLAAQLSIDPAAIANQLQGVLCGDAQSTCCQDLAACVQSPSSCPAALQSCMAEAQQANFSLPVDIAATLQSELSRYCN